MIYRTEKYHKSHVMEKDNQPFVYGHNIWVMV